LGPRGAIDRGEEGNETTSDENVWIRHRVRLARGEFPAGEFTRTWDGRDGQGRPVGSGTYFLRMEAAGYRASRKMVLIK
jgi:flagellar hook assembly protein FlgD